MGAGFVVRGATVLDGSGGEPQVADVVVRDGRIYSVVPSGEAIAISLRESMDHSPQPLSSVSGVGESEERRRTGGEGVSECEKVHKLTDVGAEPDLADIDGDGFYLAPGFIDCHCHDDLAMLQDPDRPEKIVQGVTTVVVGNCGFSLFPCTASSKDSLRSHAGGLLGSVGLNEVFEGVDAYSKALLDRGIALNVVPLVGHGPLRLEVLGFDPRAATFDERRRMADRLESQLNHGAAGLSLGLVYPPSAFADREELLALCKAAARCGKPVAAHIRSYEAGLLDATHEFLDLLRESSARGVLSHLQAAGRPNWGLVTQALDALEGACKEGIDVSFDMYPYLAGSSYALQLLPPSALAGGVEALKSKFRSPEERAQLWARIEAAGVDSEGWQSKINVIGWESVLIAGTEVASLKELEGKTIADAAVSGTCHPFDILERLVLEENGATALVLFQLAEADSRAAFSHPLHMVGSDGIPRREGRPHPRAYGAFPRVLNKLAATDHWFSLADAVRRMTSEPAKRFGLNDRGWIRPGAVADLVLFEPTFRDTATYEDPRRLAQGARYVWVSGRAVLAEHKPTGIRPGRVLSG